MPGPSTAELNGLNPQVQVEPLTLAIVSLPPTFVEDALVELPPPPPHPATTIGTAASKISHLKRFIDPPFPVRRPPAPRWRESPPSALRAAASQAARAPSDKSAGTCGSALRQDQPMTTPFGKFLNKRNIASAVSWIN